MTDLDLTQMLTTVQQIALDAGSVLHDAYFRPRQIDFKGEVNLVTQTDHDAEKLIVEALQSHYPDIAILAEESGGIDGPNDLQWLIDPLDGTNNFAHGFPIFAVSIALRDEKGPLLGVVYDPLRDEMFSAAQGGGATLNNETITVSAASKLVQGLLATGFAYDRHEAEDNNVAAFSLFLRRAQGVRRAGAAALDLAWVACGRLDGYWEMKLHSWDIGAGMLIVREAGGKVTSYAGKEENGHLLRAESVVASNGLIHDDMLRTLTEVYEFDARGNYIFKGG